MPPPSRPKRPAPPAASPAESKLDATGQAIVAEGVQSGAVGDNLVELVRRVYTRTLLRVATAGRGGRTERHLPKQIACEVLHGMLGYTMAVEELERLLDGDDSLEPKKPADAAASTEKKPA